jgi:FixJ family two-component response regulator
MTPDALVLVVDDDRSVRTGLCRILRTAGHAVEAFGSAQQLLERLRSVDRPCCVVSDIRLPGVDGLALQDALQAANAPVSLLFMTAFADVPTTLRVMKRGALDLLEKPVSASVLLPAVAAALDRARKEIESHDRVEELRRRYRTLTPRERQVFALVTSGLLNKQVGFELGTSEKTVKVQRAHLIDKMGARSLADLVRMADRLGISPCAGAPPAGWAGDPSPAATGARAG